MTPFGFLLKIQNIKIYLKRKAILTCQLAIALHMKTSELNAPDGFALTWQHLRKPMQHFNNWYFLTINSLRKYWHTMAHRPRKASSFSISSRILHKLIDHQKKKVGWAIVTLLGHCSESKVDKCAQALVLSKAVQQS